uniref:Latartoxin-1a n=1 Tax=Lachesana tarabaevi TaxID=379576 RepID=LTX1A_LACTA|nr:RecName: Full=Latartoxin-1a; Short=LtTx-1a; Flags: Precursor [Lachesana tarabaevi]AFX65326.1 precursor toxin Tx 1a [Lachesana tarabaevi]AFX65327.1 precursor toxin Tx 1a-1 [Lachesana tarabaevi]
MKVLVFAIVCSVLLQVVLSADEEARECIPTKHDCTNDRKNCCPGHECKCYNTQIGGSKKEQCGCKKSLLAKAKNFGGKVITIFKA